MPLISSVVVILAFSLLAYTLTYNFRHPVARWFSFLLGLVMVTYASEVALRWVVSADSARLWLRFQWLGIALLPWAYYTFSYSILRTTNYRTDRRRLVNVAIVILSLFSALLAFFSTLLVGPVEFDPLFSFLQPGLLFWPFAAFFAAVVILSHFNIWKARQRCLTAGEPKAHDLSAGRFGRARHRLLSLSDRPGQVIGGAVVAGVDPWVRHFRQHRDRHHACHFELFGGIFRRLHAGTESCATV